ncbi:MAG: cyclase family protein [bacterium]|jgi:kynurenine formamidase|nr:cyclase family protein [bacterium]MDD4152881.1 cyclase family protein [bacterium]MDD4558918.1 cyclase family protein [bacterium]
MRYGQVRDISGWIYSGMWSYCPEYPGAEITDLPHPEFLPSDYPVYLQKFIISGQTGTYIETKAHVDLAAEPVTALPLKDFYRPAVVINVGNKRRNEPVIMPDLKAASPEICPGDAVLICSGWDAHWDDPDYVNGSPYIDRDAAMWLFDRGIGLLGADFPRFDSVSQMQFPWEEFWTRVNLLLAPLTNLSELSGRCGMLAAFPLKIRGACASPCRAVLIDTEEKPCL